MKCTNINEFPDFLLNETDAVSIGNFTLKSGRKTNIFINLGNINNGWKLTKLVSFYTHVIMNTILKENENLQVIVGPPYKGIPLATAIVLDLFNTYYNSFDMAYYRKEAKSCGERGLFVGHKVGPHDKVLLVDDVFTEGTAKFDAIKKLPKADNIIGVLVAVDREERTKSGNTYSAAFTSYTGIPVYSICTKKDIIAIAMSKDKMK
jgi:orotate phosphoribosyltransferase